MTNDYLPLAKQGDINAIASLMNLYFQPQGITAIASIRDGCLQLMLESEQVSDKASSMAFIRQEFSTWQPALINTVRIYGRRPDEPFPDWEEVFYIIRQKSQPATFLAALRTFKFSSVVPYKDVFSLELYSNNTVRLLLFFGLFPLVIGLIVNPRNLEQAAWLLGIYYASIWGVVLYNLIKPAWFSWQETLKCVVFTAIVGIPLLLLIQRFPLFQLLYAATESNLGLIPQLIGFIFGVGVLEELCKALPVYLFLLRPQKLNEPLTGAFYGAMSGLGFAIAEGGSYSLLYAFNLVRGQSGFGTYILANTIRFVSLPLFHAILAGIVGYFLGLAAINRSRQLPIMFIGVALAAVLHGSYNTFSNGVLGLVIISFTILLFVAYLRRSQQMVAQMQEAELGRPVLPPDIAGDR
ncbi:PrsW family intramembrane metalloprotease [Anabaena subtropica]|uniref:PrsW family intramembrane metalloprotease n=1 Tax=Anabaena subtropica FACHB-260 TaxID=2692884 RepID=A0ABR8CRL3_9NOST|nr:PrsW family intramembrane metalloprotease [Anabaena subtropica]MBD2345044.1 PrsW family intramembrane metalloprotease [Anabaena subtropica FACHB-260]